MIQDSPFPGFGLTKNQFFRHLPDHQLRQFLDGGVLSVLDQLFGGGLAGDELRKVAGTLVDLDTTLKDPQGRRLVLRLIPAEKRAELRTRTERDIRPQHADSWTPQEVRRLRNFFGIADDERTPVHPTALGDVEPKYGLFDHQRATLHDLMPFLLNDDRRAVLHLPTGAGKTRMAMHVVAHFLRRNDPSLVVWLASSQELLEQASSEFRLAWQSLGTRPLRVASMWGRQMPSLTELTDGFVAVGLAKAWSHASREDPDWAARLSDRVRLVVFDEAHQTVAPTYRQLTGDFALNPNCSILGLTATPGRTWEDIDHNGNLASFYSGNKVTLKVGDRNPVTFLIENDFLAKPRFRNLFSVCPDAAASSPLAALLQSSDISPSALDELTANKFYIEGVLSAVHKLLDEGHNRVLVFAATVRHGTLLTAVLAARGLEAHLVTALTETRTRNRAIHRFRAPTRDPVILVNYGVLTTGFDAPATSSVVIARPTKSLVLYSQMVGRAIRGPRVGGTTTCDVITVVEPTLPGFRDIAEAFLNWENSWT